MMRALATAALAWGLALSPACASECSPSLAYVGTDGTQLRAIRLDACGAGLAMIGPVAEQPKPRWAVAAKDKLYVAADGRVTAYRIDAKTAALTPLNEAPAGGEGTTHLWLGATTLLTANFGAGSVASLPVQPDGKLADPISVIKATGSGPHRRQASPHAHGISVDPTGRYALVADMGADRVFVYGFGNGKLSTGPEPFVTPAGSGPRRAVFDAAGRFVYVLNELTAELMVLKWNAPQLTPVQTVPMHAGEGTVRSGADFALSRDGRFAYAINRGQNELQTYAVDARTGELTLLQRIPSGGEGPWAFDIDKSGQALLVANYRSNRLSLFEIDRKSGLLADTGKSLDSPAPVSITFVE